MCIKREQTQDEYGSLCWFGLVVAGSLDPDLVVVRQLYYWPKGGCIVRIMIKVFHLFVQGLFKHLFV